MTDYKIFLRLFALLLILSSPFQRVLSNLEPTQEMSNQTRWVVNTINDRHYLKDSIGILDGHAIVEAYIESFDYSRMYFLKPQIDVMICLRQKNGKVRIVENTCAFIVRLNIIVAEDSRRLGMKSSNVELG